MLLRGYVLAAALLAAVLGCPRAFSQDDPAEVVQDQIIVWIAEPFVITDVISLLQPFVPGGPIDVVASLASRNLYLLSAPGAEEDTLEPMLESWVNPTPSIPDPARPLRMAELGYSYGATEGQTGSIYFGALPQIAEADFHSQYAYTMIGTPAAHAMTRGLGVRIAMLDTGIEAGHPLFSGRIAPNGWCTLQNETGPVIADAGNGLDDDADGLTDEGVGHGSYVAALALLIAPDSEILPVRVLDSDGRGDSWSLIAGMYYAIDHGAQVINLSLRSSYESDILDAACDEAAARGIIVTAAAGNAGVSSANDDREYPASGGSVLSVGATDWMDRRADFSNYGEAAFDDDPVIQLFAPGDSAGTPDDPQSWSPADCIYGAIAGGTGADFSVWEGTSMSSALVAGAAALLRAQHPEWGDCQTTHDRIDLCLKSTAVNIDAQNPGLEGYFGFGRIDIAAAVLASSLATPGDLDGDGAVSLDDLTRLLAAFGQADTCFDLDGEPSIALGDLAILLSHFGE